MATLSKNWSQNSGPPSSVPISESRPEVMPEHAGYLAAWLKVLKARQAGHLHTAASHAQQGRRIPARALQPRTGRVTFWGPSPSYETDTRKLACGVVFFLPSAWDDCVFTDS